MDDIDRTSHTYQLKKSLLRKAWDGQSKFTGPEMIAKILEMNARVHDATAHERALNAVAALKQAAEAEVAQVNEAIYDCLEQAEIRRMTGEVQDSPKLQTYIEEERRYDEQFRKQLEITGTPAHLIPEPMSEGLIRLNAIERMNGRNQRWLVTEESEKIQEAQRLVLQPYIEEERRQDEQLREYLERMGTPAHLMPKPMSEVLLRLNALERMNGNDKRWIDPENAEKIEEAQHLIQLRGRPSGPTLH